MRVLNTRTLEFREVITPSILGKYAILSHTWGEEEISFHDFYKPKSRLLQGYEKIQRCCSVAHSDGYKYLWIDTCCIDKKSSAELTEAINSMYAWYSEAHMCYVYLSDFAAEDQWRPFTTETPSYKYSSFNPDLFAQSRWFSRGWTLQELLASYKIQFLDNTWRYFGDKTTLLGHISSAIGIDEIYLQDRDRIPRASVATRMSWASARVTTRIEDEAYCLMGLFEVNMPLLYGEGHKAFRRLQHEIARNYEDDSLFAWCTSGVCSDIFALSPAAFSACHDSSPLHESTDVEADLERTPFSITSRGLSVTAFLLALPFDSVHGHSSLDPACTSRELVLLSLNCSVRSRRFCILLVSLSRDTFARFLPRDDMVYENYYRIAQSHTEHRSNKRRTIYIQGQQSSLFSAWPQLRDTVWIVKILQYPTTCKVTPPGYFSRENHYFEWEPPADISGQIYFEGKLAIYWGGFAVLEYRSSHRTPYFVVLRHYCSKEGLQGVRFSILDQAISLTAAMRTCYSKRDSLEKFTVGLNEVSDEHTAVGNSLSFRLLMEKKIGYTYVLAPSTSDLSPSNEVTFHDFSGPD
ncbi:MAG: hypothetical protein Q9228_006016 [Teloschistes exilis]